MHKRRGGIIAKYSYSTYEHARSKYWLKFKCRQQQELIIGGFTAPAGIRKRFGALLVGYYQGRKLRYAGKVGTGFSEAMLENLYLALIPLIVDENPFSEVIKEPHKITWVEPKLVGEFNFSEWIQDGKLRHPSFKGLRLDINPFEVSREFPET